jgi:hypothetical protein
LLFAKEAFPLAGSREATFFLGAHRLAAAANLIICNFASAPSIGCEILSAIAPLSHLLIRVQPIPGIALGLLFCCRAAGWSKKCGVDELSCQMASYTWIVVLLPIVTGIKSQLRFIPLSM